MDQKLVTYSIHITEHYVNKLQISMFNFLLSVKSDKHSPKHSLCTDYCNEMKTTFLLRKKALTKPPHEAAQAGYVPMGSHVDISWYQGLTLLCKRPYENLSFYIL